MQSQTARTATTTRGLEAVVVAEPPERAEISPAQDTRSARATDGAAGKTAAALVVDQAVATPTNLAGDRKADPGMPAEGYESRIDPVSAQEARRSDTAGDRFLVVFVILVLLATIGIFVVLFSRVASTT
jgi:hypothetical protein